MNAPGNKLLRAACLLLLCLWALPATAQPDKTTAQALFDEGKRLMDAANYAEACPKLAESQRLDPAGGTMLNLALCYEKVGKTASAWGLFKEVRELARNKGRRDSEALAQDHIEALEPILSRLTIDVPTAARVDGLEVSRDGVLIRPATWGVAIPTDPGELVIEARAPGHEPWTTKTVLAAEADAQTVTVPKLAPAKAAPTGGPAPPPPAPPPDEDAADGSNGQLLAGIVVAGIGGVAAGVGGVFGGLAMAKESEANDLCGSDEDLCPYSAGVEASDTARTYAKVANGLIFGGLGVVAVGVVVALTAPSDDEVSVGGLVPWVDQEAGGFLWRATW